MFTHLIRTGADGASIAFKTPNRPAFICSACNEVIACAVSSPDAYVMTPGYSIDRVSDRVSCYPCTDRAQLLAMLDRTRSHGAYLSSDGRTVTTWTGGKLGDVIQSHATALPFGRRHSWVHGSGYLAVRVRDTHGGLWFGKGSPGVCVTLRPLKG